MYGFGSRLAIRLVIALIVVGAGVTAKFALRGSSNCSSGSPTSVSADHSLYKPANLQKAIHYSGAQVSHGPLPTVVADATQLTQVFQNLVENAIKYRGSRSPEVRIEAERAEGGWRFAVRDNGIGLDPKFHERLFVIFQRLHTREEYPGTGIGLALCKKVVERHGGRIWLESRPGQGTTFYFTIPDGEG